MTRSIDAPQLWFENCYSDPDSDAFGEPSDEMLDLSTTIRPGARVLDVGCGEGRHAVLLAERGARVFAFDTSLRAVLKLRRRTRLGAHPAPLVWIQDVVTGIPDAPFDLIICHGILHFLPPEERRLALGLVQKRTAPGGINVIAVFTTKLPAPPDMAPFLLGLYEEGELREAYAGWQLLLDRSYTFRDSHPGGIKHHHAVDKIVAQKPKES